MKRSVTAILLVVTAMFLVAGCAQTGSTTMSSGGSDTRSLVIDVYAPGAPAGQVAIVMLDGSVLGEVSALRGKAAFYEVACDKNVPLRVECEGYETYEKSLDIRSSSDALWVEIKMQPLAAES